MNNHTDDKTLLLKHLIQGEDFTCIAEMPIEWRFYRPLENGLGTFFGTKKIHFVKKEMPFKKVEQYTQQHHTFDKDVLMACVFVIDLMETPEDIKNAINHSSLTEKRGDWLLKTMNGDDYNDRRDHYQLQGYSYIMDYDVERILESVLKIE